jgi:hypothetical protein
VALGLVKKLAPVLVRILNVSVTQKIKQVENVLDFSRKKLVLGVVKKMALGLVKKLALVLIKKLALGLVKKMALGLVKKLVLGLVRILTVRATQTTKQVRKLSYIVLNLHCDI